MRQRRFHPVKLLQQLAVWGLWLSLLGSFGCARGLPRVTEWPAELLAPIASESVAALRKAGTQTTEKISQSSPVQWLTDGEWQRLQSGGRVAHPMSFGIRSGHYIGGWAVQRISHSPDTLTDFITDADSILNWMPFTRRAEVVSGSSCELVLELDQGTDIYSKVYSIRAFRVGRSVQWRLAPDRPHDIDDIWGYFRAVPFQGGSLLILGIVADLRIGPLAVVFDDIVTKRMLKLPTHIRREVGYRTAPSRQSAEGDELPCASTSKSTKATTTQQQPR